MPCGLVSVLSRVLAERAEHDSVLHGQAPQLQWGVQLGDGLVVGLGVQRSSAGDGLLRREVGDLHPAC